MLTKEMISLNASYPAKRRRPGQVAPCFGTAHSAYAILAIWIALIAATSLLLALI
ncbi:hypothetical protein ACLMAL_28760 [Nocardia sp. CWNU-33]|uniref:hypothetical protein n=1 Tax=Nocardia sp. CWNU-33 TaxID=3392117 RepID=UPI00398F19A9